MRRGLLITSVLGLVLSFLAIQQGINYPSSSISPTPVPISNTPTPSDSSTSQLFTVTKVVDGDTIEIDYKTKVRLIGINTPETVDPRRGVECFGHEASDFTKSLLSNKQVRLEKDISETDKFGRLLRYVYLDNLFVNEHLVRQGYAQVSTYPPDVKYQKLFEEAQTEARQKNLGLWQSCNK